MQVQEGKKVMQIQGRKCPLAAWLLKEERDAPAGDKKRPRLVPGFLFICKLQVFRFYLVFL